MYCSLQEAYNIPSFDPASGKKKRIMPSSCSKQLPPPQLQRQRQPLNPQNISLNYDTDISASAYDVYSNDNGGEMAVANVKYGREDFATQQPTNTELESNNITYNSKGNDYKYYCDKYNVCPKKQVSNDNVTIVSEGFTTAQTPSEGLLPSYANNGGKCSSLQAPAYQVPISDAARLAYSKAMNANMTHEQVNTPPSKSVKRLDNMNDVSSYDENDLEEYLQTKDMKSAFSPTKTKMEVPTNVSEESTPFSKAIANMKSDQLGYPSTPVMTSSISSINNIDTNNMKVLHEPIQQLSKLDYILDIVLFVLIGILLILLCDQIFKAAMLYGMKETMRMLNPYLQQVQDNIE
jgi:hypothetical protein